jgi:hypothetical protein
MTHFDPPLEFIPNSTNIPPHQIPSCPFPSIVFPLICPIPRGPITTIVDNVISYNGLSGLAFNGGLYEVKSNKIFENWLWGLIIKSKSSTYLREPRFPFVACDVQCNCSSQSRIRLLLTQHHRHHIYQECKILNTLFHQRRMVE